MEGVATMSDETSDVTTSGELAELVGALAKASGDFGKVAKNADNPHFRTTYADLSSASAATRVALAANGLAVVQMPIGPEVLRTTLYHSSGQFIQAHCPILWSAGGGGGGNPAQKFGGGLTYSRRYAYMAMLGLAPEDDDGSGSGGQQGQRQQGQRQQGQRQQGQRQPKRPQSSAPPRIEPENRGGKGWAEFGDFREWLTVQNIVPQAYVDWRKSLGRDELDLTDPWAVGGTWVKCIQDPKRLDAVRAWMAEQHTNGGGS